ncbi:MAG: hypothetical protein SH857_16670 [Chitinophagales bacterium]|nr:hypothetical protein [Chitinophagales bacterium]
MLQLIKLLHTIIWAFLTGLIFFILYAAITGAITTCTWAAIGLVLAECIVLLFNGWACPLTAIAGKYTAVCEDNFDIYLPL